MMAAMNGERIIQYSENLEREMRAQANSLRGRFSLWSLAGNGAALVLCFNALAANSICDWAAVQPLARLFLFGLATAVGAAVFSAWSLDRGAVRMAKIIASMHKASSHAGVVTKLSTVEPVETDHETELPSAIEKAEAKARKEIEEMNRNAKIAWWEHLLPWVSNGMLFISVLFFGWALFSAIESDQLTGALCSSAP